MGCGSPGPGASALARLKMSWLKNGISVFAWALLKSMALWSVPPATGTPTRVAKYARTSLRKSNSSIRNSPSVGEKVKPAASRSITVAPAAVSASTAASNASSTGCGVGTNGSNPPNPTRVTPSFAPWRPFLFTNKNGLQGAKLGVTRVGLGGFDPFVPTPQPVLDAFEAAVDALTAAGATVIDLDAAGFTFSSGDGEL